MQYSYQLPKLSKLNKYILIVYFVLFILDSVITRATGASLGTLFGFSASMVFKGHIYQLITYPLVANGLFSFLFNSLIIWFIGSELEQLWGWRRYTNFCIFVTLATSITLSLILSLFSTSLVYGVSLSGAYIIVGAMCVCYGILFPTRVMLLFLFPVQARYFVLILLGISLYQGIFTPYGIYAWSQLIGYCFAYLWMLAIARGINCFPVNFFKDNTKKKRFSIVSDDENHRYH